MSRESAIFVLGVLLLIVPQLGVPEIWKEAFFLGEGILLLVLGYSLRRSAYIRSIEHENGERSTDSFVESTRMIEWSDDNQK